jgi:hypothetical protein
MTEPNTDTQEMPARRKRGRPIGWRGKYKPRLPKGIKPEPQIKAAPEIKKAQAKRGRLANGQFQPGTSGNPHGGALLKHRHFSNLAVAAREYAELALERLVYLVTDGDTHNVQLAAALALLDRGYGRPVATLDLKADIKSTNVNVFADLTPSDQRVITETLKAIEHRPDALELAVDILQDDGPIDAIPADVLEPAA